MSLEAEISDVVRAALRGAVAELRAELGRSRLVPIKETVVAYRAILEAERAGVLQVYRIGHASLVDEGELYDWIRRTGAAREKQQQQVEPSDEIGELIAIGDRRRRTGGKARA